MIGGFIVIQVKCIQKIRDKNDKIVGYLLRDANGKEQQLGADFLKAYIKNGDIVVTNLTLTSNGKLVSKKTDEENNSKQQPVKISTYCNHVCYITGNSREHTLIIPDNVTQLNGLCDEDIDYFTQHIKRLHGKLKVVGGNKLKQAVGMFKDCKFNHIDITEFNTSNVTNMSHMFDGCKATVIDFGAFSTSKVTDMSYMFNDCKTKELDLKTFNTFRVKNMRNMFSGTNIENINLSSFNTSRVTDMNSMFKDCTTTILDLTSFNTNNVGNMGMMFKGCKASLVDLSSFKTSKPCMGEIFKSSRIKLKANDKIIKKIYLEYTGKETLNDNS